MNVLILLLSLGGAWAQSPSTGPDPRAVVGEPAGPTLSGDALELQTKAVATLLRCPVCQGLSVEASPSESAQALRNEVKVLVAAGYDQEQILAYFEASYGDFILLDPKKEGFALWVWVLPVVFLGLGGAVVMGSMKGRPAKAAVAIPPVDPALSSYLERVRNDTKEGQELK